MRLQPMHAAEAKLTTADTAEPAPKVTPAEPATKVAPAESALAKLASEAALTQ